ncbi:MAG: hypothetical protein HC774_01965, partial [Sphingomonadales bacterium]|nr:hypothetical protein [Sphingomonadales bacterium]
MAIQNPSHPRDSYQGAFAKVADANHTPANLALDQAQNAHENREKLLADIHERDARDRSRSFAPLVPAGDAYVLDTTDLDIDAAVAAAIRYVETRVAKRSA